MSRDPTPARELTLMHDPFPGVRTGCNTILLRGMAVPLLLVGGLLLWTGLRDLAPGVETGFGVILVIFGLLCWLGANNQKSMDFRFGVQVDADRGELRYFKDHPESAWTVPFSRIVGLTVRKESEAATGDGPPTFYFALFAVLRDGAEVWILSRTDESEAVEAVRSVQALLPVPTVDRARLGVEREGAVPTGTAAAPAPSLTASDAVSMVETDGVTRIGLHHRRSWSARMIPALMMAFFLAIPLLITTVACGAALSDPHPAALVGAGLAVLVTGGIIALLVLMMLTIWQDYVIELRPDQVRVEQRFRVGILQHWFGRTLSVSPEQVEGVRVSVSHGGAARLSMVVRGSPKVVSKSRLFAQGAFRESLDGQTEIALWAVAAGEKSGSGPGLCDLGFLEHFLQSRLDAEDG